MARTRLHGAVARRPVAALALLVALAFLTVGAAPAQAGKTLDSILGSTGTGAGQFGNLGGVEVRQSTGQIYVVDRGNHRVQRFAADGTFELMWGRDVKVGGVTTHEVCTAADADTGSGGVGCKAGTAGNAAGELASGQARGIAIDQASGDVYVADQSNRRIQRFDADGAFLLAWGRDVLNPTGGTTHEVCTATDADTGSGGVGCKAGVSGSGAGEFASGDVHGLAVDSIGDVYVGDRANKRIQKFAASGAFLSAWGWDVDPNQAGAAFEVCLAPGPCTAGGGTTTDLGAFQNADTFLAVDSSDNVFVSQGNSSLFPGMVQRFGASGAAPAVFSPGELSGSGSAYVGAIAIDRTDDHLYAAKRADDLSETRVKEVEPAGSLVDTHAVNAGIESGDAFGALALHEASGRLYVATSQGGRRVLVFDDDGGAPPADVNVEPATAVGAHDASFHATIDPNGSDTTYRFEYSRNGTDWAAAGTVQSAGSGDVAVPVSTTVTGLDANTLYRVRIVSTTEFVGTFTSEELVFATDAVAPEVSHVAVQNRASTSARLVGTVNANNLPTTYRFEIGRTAAHGTSVPAVPASAGSAAQGVRVGERVEDLQPATEYHYRLVATNSEGTTASSDRTFVTRSTVEAPPGRAYEMVTPPDKNNRRLGGVAGHDQRFAPSVGVPSTDGERVLVTLNNGILDPNSGVAATQLVDGTLLSRGESGWTGEDVYNVELSVELAASTNATTALSANLLTQSWWQGAEVFPSGISIGTRRFGDDGGFLGSGWYDWFDGATVPTTFNPTGRDSVAIGDEGEWIHRWGTYYGLNGAGDPSASQFAPTPAGCVAGGALNCATFPGGRAIYRQEPVGSGARQLVSECTGSGAGATQIPERDDQGTPSPADDKLGSMPCEAGSVTSRRGATLGSATATGTLATAVSADGRRTFFTSPDPSAPLLPNTCTTVTTLPSPALAVGPNTLCPPQLFVRQVNAAGEATVRWISRPAIADQVPTLLGRATFEGASADGGTVYFRTNSPLVADDKNGGAGAPGGVLTGNASNNSWDLYRYDLPEDLEADPAGGVLTRISGGPTGDADPAASCSDISGCAAGSHIVAPYISDDGERAYFVTTSPIAGADVTAPDGGTTEPGGTPANQAHTRNLYLYDGAKSGADRWTFVARFSDLPGGGTAAGNAALCATMGRAAGFPIAWDANGGLTWSPEGCLRGTPSGDAIVFQTPARLTEDDQDDSIDIYAYDADADELTRVTAPPSGTDGYVCTEDSQFTSINDELVCNGSFGHEMGLPERPDAFGRDGRRHANLAVAPDGELSVFFESGVRLVPEDGNDRRDVYRWTSGELSLVSPGSSDDDAYYSGNTLDGQDVFFVTSQRIDPREIDADFDVYDARVGGGFPAPPDPDPSCDLDADACQGAGRSGASSLVEGGDAGPGNVELGERTELTLTRPSARALRRAARRGLLGVRISTNARARLVVTASARVGAGTRRRVRVIARSAKRVSKPGTYTLRLRLSGAAKTELRRRGRLRLALRADGGNARQRRSGVTLRLTGNDVGAGARRGRSSATGR